MVEKLTEQDSYFEHIAVKAELLATKAELQATKDELQDTKAKLQDTQVKQDDAVNTKAKQQHTKRQDEFDQKGKPPTKKRKVEITRSSGGNLLWNWSLCSCGEYDPSDQRLADVEEDKPGMAKPSSFKLDFGKLKASRRASLKNALEGADKNLEVIVRGELIKQSTMAAILTEMELRLGSEDTSILKPSITTPWTFHEVHYDAGGEVAAAEVKLQTTKHVFYVLWSDAPRHYTCLYVRSIEGEPRHIEFKDSCPNETARLAATKLLRNLKLIGPEEQAPPPSNTSRESNGWSCGLWSSRWVERQIRENLGEPRLPPASLAEMISRANEFISKIKEASDNERGQAKRGNSTSEIGKPSPTHEQEHQTFEVFSATSVCLPKQAPRRSCRPARSSCRI